MGRFFLNTIVATAALSGTGSGVVALTPSRNGNKASSNTVMKSDSDKKVEKHSSASSLASLYSKVNRLDINVESDSMHKNLVSTKQSWHDLLKRLPVVFAKIIEKKDKKKRDWFSDCAAFTYHDVQDSSECYTICETKSDTEVKNNCQWYSSIVDLCDEEEYKYASRSTTAVTIPSDLKSRCDLGNSVDRCKVCDRALTLAEQDTVNDTAWWITNDYSWVIWYAVYVGLFLLGAIGIYVAYQKI